MKIKTRLTMSAILPVVFGLVMVTAILFSWKQMNEVRKEDALIGDMVVAASDMNSLIYEYIIYPVERIKTQWLSKYDSAYGVIIKLRAVHPGDPILEDMDKDLQKVKGLFLDLATEEEIPQEWRERLSIQLTQRTQTTWDKIRRLDESGHERLALIQKRVDWFVIVLFAVLSLVMVLMLSHGARVIVRHIRGLLDAVKIIGAGNLDYRIGAYTRDEVGEVSMAFDKMAEDLKKHREDLEAANKELEAFSYSVSHDLRAPLRAIDGFSHIILDDYRDKLDDEGKRLLNVVRENTKKMGRLIEDILAFSRMGRKEMSITEIDMEKLVNDVYAEIKASVPERKLQFNVKPLAPAYGDTSMLRQVVSNLLSNAVKFTRQRESGVIEMGGWTEGENPPVSPFVKGGLYESPVLEKDITKFPPLEKGGEGGFEKQNIYYIKDNGVGFDTKYADKLFGVFQRLHSAEEFEGTGIGLAIVKRIITRHGGSVRAEGKVGEGAVFYFALPKKP